MSPTPWSFPNHVLFGTGSADHAGTELARFEAGRVLLVADRSALDGGLVEEVGTTLKKAKLGYEVFAGAGTVARERQVQAALTAYRDAEAEAVVAVGSEGAVEVGKLLRLALRAPEGLEAWLDQDEHAAPRAQLPALVAVPTRPGSGAEVRARTSLVRDGTGYAAVLDLPALRPDVAILDPEIVTGSPVSALAEGAFDALTWAIEGLSSAAHHPAAGVLGVAALERLAPLLAGLPDADAIDQSQAQRWIEGAHLGALAGDAGEGACRSLTRTLVGTLDVSSGLAASLTLPAVLDYNRSACPARLARVATALGARGDETATLAFEAAGAVRALRRTAGLPDGLEAVGLEEDAIGAVAARAAAEGTHLGNPRACGENDLEALLRASW